MRRAKLLAAWAALVIGGIVLGGQYQSLAPSASRERADILLDVFGEFRTVLARYLWFKMDLFHEVLDDEGVDHDKQVEILPLLRMISLLDPSMTDSYDNIAWDLYKGHKLDKQALSILDEGLERNPRSFQLWFRRALITHQMKDYQASVDAARKAVEFAQDEFDVLNANRILYWSAKETKEKAPMISALDKLIEMRPQEQLWRTERAKL
jgi:tetratricopeptide (TPR) repeat protein